jgi:hypothetical protein
LYKHEAGEAGVFKQNSPLFLSPFIVCVLLSLEGIHNNISSTYEREAASAQQERPPTFAAGITLWFIYLEPKKVLAVWRRRGMAKWNTPLRCCQLERLIAAPTGQN